ncbi:hypothetical protein, partial [Tsukamurella sputi]
MKQCIDCGEKINKSARLCKYCKTYQDWRRFLSLSNTTIALLIAFLSVITLSTDSIYRAYKSITTDKEKAYFHLALDTVAPENAVITIKNLGESHIIVPDSFLCLVFLANDDYSN